jgi:hypothetical protein
MSRVVIVLSDVRDGCGLGDDLRCRRHGHIVLRGAELEIASHHIDEVVLHLDVALGGR